MEMGDNGRKNGPSSCELMFPLAWTYLRSSNILYISCSAAHLANTGAASSVASGTAFGYSGCNYCGNMFIIVHFVAPDVSQASTYYGHLHAHSLSAT